MDLGDDLEDPVDDTVPGEPIADAGADQLINPLTDVRLDASASYDPEGYELVAAAWTLTTAPPGSTAALIGADTPNPEFWADIAGDYIIELTVQNDQGVWDSTPDEVVVTAEPQQEFYVQLTWDAYVDLDLHLLQTPTSPIFQSPGDCNYCNMTPSWGGTPQSSPSLDWDEIPGLGPETTTIMEPADGDYRVVVHYYGQDGLASCPGACPATTATVRVFVGGVEDTVLVRSMDMGQGMLWDVVTVSVSNGNVVVVANDKTGQTEKISCY